VTILATEALKRSILLYTIEIVQVILMNKKQTYRSI